MFSFSAQTEGSHIKSLTGQRPLLAKAERSLTQHELKTTKEVQAEELCVVLCLANARKHMEFWENPNFEKTVVKI